MDSGRAIRLLLANGLRVIHIALWMTLPTVFWLWLGSPTPAACVPKYGWYKGNVLCVSEDAHLWITAGLFFLGFLVVSCWVYGYCFEIVIAVLRGDKRLPALRMMSAVEGCGLWCFSLKYWLPAIGFLIAITVYADSLPLSIGSRAYAALLMMAAPVWLAFVWGQVVGLARYATTGDHTLLYHRRENIRLALANFRSSISLTVLLIATAIGATVVLAASEFLVVPLRDADQMVKVALGTLYFFFVLLAWCIACSHLVARYARKIGIGDNLKDGERLG